MDLAYSCKASREASAEKAEARDTFLCASFADLESLGSVLASCYILRLQWSVVLQLRRVTEALSAKEADSSAIFSATSMCLSQGSLGPPHPQKGLHLGLTTLPLGHSQWAL